MKVIISGSRNLILDDASIDEAVRLSGFYVTEVISGMAHGVDTSGKVWANKRKIPVIEVPAAWDDIKAPGAVVRETASGEFYNLLAGLWRNQDMAHKADALIAIWIHHTNGTADMIAKMRKLHKAVYVHTLKGYR